MIRYRRPPAAKGVSFWAAGAVAVMLLSAFQPVQAQGIGLPGQSSERPIEMRQLA